MNRNAGSLLHRWRAVAAVLAAGLPVVWSLSAAAAIGLAPLPVGAQQPARLSASGDAERATAPAASASRLGGGLDVTPSSPGFQPYVPPGDSLLNLNLPRLGDAGNDDLSPMAERRLGDSILRELRAEGAMLDDIELSDFLNRFAARLTETSPARGYSFEFFLVKDESLNAFALPGGLIGVHTGLIEAAQTESELASVLGHEMGHVIQRHIARMLAQQRQTSLLQLAGLVLGVLAARSNPQAAMGAMTMGAGAQQQMMLSFSRDAEREADRVGLEILREAGFDPTGMVAFFGRLQNAGRLYEGAPAYLRSHPLTTERIADMQARIREQRYVQRPDSMEFRLVRAKLTALADGSVDGLRRTRAVFERQLREKTTGDEMATWFGIAIVALAQRDYDGSTKALAEVRRRLASAAPASPAQAMLDRLAAETRLQQRDPQGALAIAQAGLQRSPQSRALIYVQAGALIDAGQAPQATRFLEDQIAIYRSDANLWRLLARSYANQGQDALAHRASAEQYALTGGWMSAIEQLRLAQRSGKLDFYTASQVDTRLQEFQAIYTREKQEREGR
ncbi:MAG: M48 family metalloprotease [Burkholderiaceae bacterium]